MSNNSPLLDGAESALDSIVLMYSLVDNTSHIWHIEVSILMQFLEFPWRSSFLVAQPFLLSSFAIEYLELGHNSYIIISSWRHSQRSRSVLEHILFNFLHWRVPDICLLHKAKQYGQYPPGPLDFLFQQHHLQYYTGRHVSAKWPVRFYAISCFCRF